MHWLKSALFRIRYRKIVNYVRDCECGTEGSCMACAPAVCWLEDLWNAWPHGPNAITPDI